MDLSLEDEDHPVCRSAFLEKNVAGLADNLLAVLREPDAFFEG
jgi:hypothetical protein